MAALYSDIEQKEDAAVKLGTPLPAVVSVSSGWADWQVCPPLLSHLQLTCQAGRCTLCCSHILSHLARLAGTASVAVPRASQKSDWSGQIGRNAGTSFAKVEEMMMANVHTCC